MADQRGVVAEFKGIDITPSWPVAANIAIALIEDGTPRGNSEGRILVREMAVKLSDAQAMLKRLATLAEGLSNPMYGEVDHEISKEIMAIITPKSQPIS